MALESRKEMRPAMRDDDPRARAAARAAQLLDHIGDLDEGTDDFQIDRTIIPDGWDYEWKTKTVYGKEDPAYQVAIARKGWEPVPASRHPSFMPSGSTDPVIERKGMVLMERPMEITERARAIEAKNARSQVRQKEQQLASAPDGQFDRNNKGDGLVNVRKSYGAIPIPTE